MNKEDNKGGESAVVDAGHVIGGSGDPEMGLKEVIKRLEEAQQSIQVLYENAESWTQKWSSLYYQKTAIEIAMIKMKQLAKGKELLEWFDKNT